METTQPQPGTENKSNVETRSQGSSRSSVSLPEVIFTQTAKTTSEATTSHDDVNRKTELSQRYQRTKHLNGDNQVVPHIRSR